MKDPLLQSLAYISRFYGQANSPDALIADLPLTDGLLTPYLLPRAAEKAGLQAKQSQLAIDKTVILDGCAILVLFCLLHFKPCGIWSELANAI
jgi:ABC-type bacteriocin/lantibiotic exporter with double-glycine peptidase domain